MYNQIYFKNKFLRYLIPVLFLGVVVYIFISRCQLKKHFTITNAEITSVGRTTYKGKSLIEYRYTTNESKIINASDFLPLHFPESLELVGKTIPCAYNKDKSLSQLLVYKWTWKQYKLQFPDSLNWLFKYIDQSQVIYTY